MTNTEHPDPFACLEPGVPAVVTRMADAGWRSIGGRCWILGVPEQGATGAALLCTHLDARDPGRQCPATPRSLGAHQVTVAEPLSLEPSLLCEVCGWHGFVRAGEWVPA